MENKLLKTFTAKRLALCAMFVAISYGLSFLEFPVFPAAPFLKLDFSFSMQLVGAYILGPLLGEFIVIAVQLLRLLTSSTGGVGEIANLVAATCFVFVPSLIYKFKKGLATVFLSMAIGSLLAIGASLLSNRFLTFPLYMGAGAQSAFLEFFWIIAAFNAIKCVGNAAITFILYKRLKKSLSFFL
ncbi:MAG: ECF transporter S component [Clostridia bacterium]|nr:ECF transporter S component [Clostridia bacterium]